MFLQKLSKSNATALNFVFLQSKANYTLKNACTHHENSRAMFRWKYLSFKQKQSSKTMRKF